MKSFLLLVSFLLLSVSTPSLASTAPVYQTLCGLMMDADVSRYLFKALPQDLLPAHILKTFVTQDRTGRFAAILVSYELADKSTHTRAFLIPSMTALENVAFGERADFDFPNGRSVSARSLYEDGSFNRTIVRYSSRRLNPD